MKNYTIWFETEEYEDSLFIEAESKAEAIEIAEDMLPTDAVITEVRMDDNNNDDEDEEFYPDTLQNLGLSIWDFITV